MHRTKDVSRIIRKGRRIYGATYKLPSGAVIYMAWRKTKDIFRGGENVLSSAITKGKACWAIDEETLRERRREGIKYIGVWMVDTDDRYLAPIDYFFDSKRSSILDYGSRGGALQRYLPLEHFRVSHGKTKIK